MKLFIILLLIVLLLSFRSRYTKLEKFIRSLLDRKKYQLPNDIIVDTERIGSNAKRQEVVDHIISLGYKFKRKFELPGQTRLHLFSLGGDTGSLIDLLTKGKDGKTVAAVAKVELEGGLFDDVLHNYLVLFPGQNLNFPQSGNLFGKCDEKESKRQSNNEKTLHDERQKRQDNKPQRTNDRLSHHPCLTITRPQFNLPTANSNIPFIQGVQPHLIKVGLIDSKADFTQFNEFEEVLEPNANYRHYIETENFEGMNLTIPDDHGTIMGSILASKYSGSGQLKIRSYPFHDGERGHLMDVIAAIYGAVADGVDIINLSLGYQDGESNGHLRRALEYAGAQNVFVVCAAGNFNSNNDVKRFWPANFSYMSHVVSVAAVDELGSPWIENTDIGTNYGNLSVTFATDGHQVLGYVNGSDKKQLSGTSCSAAVLSALAANIKSEDMALSAVAIKTKLLSQIDSENGIFSLNAPMA